MSTRFARTVTAALVALLLATPSLAIDTPGGGGGGGGGGGAGGGNTQTNAPATPSLADARALIAAKKWAAAVDALKDIVAADNSDADAYNLLGFSYRNLGKYDLAGRAYKRALTLNPNHTGALEYQGVLFIKLGERSKAEANLAKIKSICGTTCEAYKDLAEELG